MPFDLFSLSPAALASLSLLPKSGTYNVVFYYYCSKRQKSKTEKKQDESKTCFKTVINNWFNNPILQDRKMRGKGESLKK